MLEAALVVCRFLHYLALLTLFGVVIVPLYSTQLADRQRHHLRRIAAAAALAALFSGGLWLFFAIATMADSFSSAFDPSAAGAVLRDTEFGHLWIVRAVIGTVVLAMCGARLHSPMNRPAAWLSALLAGMLLASLAGTGHTQTHLGTTRLVHMGADGFHLLAAGAWLGGLVALSTLVASASESSIDKTEQVLVGFSGIGSAAVSILIASGLVNGWLLVGTLGALITTAYGQLLLAKLCVLGGMIAFAALNRFLLVPGLAAQAAMPRSLRTLRWSICVEQMLGLLVIAIVSLLGTMQPAIGPG